MQAADGKMRLTDVADTEQLLRLIPAHKLKKKVAAGFHIRQLPTPNSTNLTTKPNLMNQSYTLYDKPNLINSIYKHGMNLP